MFRGSFGLYITEREREREGERERASCKIKPIEVIQSEREISAIIVIDHYLCYKEPKSPYNFFLLFQYLTNYLSLKLRTNGNIERRRAILWTTRASTFSLRSHKNPFAIVTALPRCSDPKIRMKCYLNLRKLLYIENVKYF